MVTTIVITKPHSVLESSAEMVCVPHSTSNSLIALKRAIVQCTTDTILFVLEDAFDDVDASQLAALQANIDTSTALTIYPVSQERQTATLINNTPEGALKTITTSPLFPAAVVAVAKRLVDIGALPDNGSALSCLTQIAIRALGEETIASEADITISVRRGAVALTDAERTIALEQLISSANIEDLFPQHPWNTHEKESAAASYHALAAVFLKLGNPEKALDCLKLSDQLEDSPRSLALRALVAQQRGEVLGAVANMVSSLQQYEIRKKENDKHYTQFSPDNLEVINENLHAGLAALNKRDNAAALSHFTKAVFQFDPFYEESGVTRAMS
jgi:tetratricopeptide (TPR) repeat protein